LGRDRDRFAGRRILVVGARHSAANTVLALPSSPQAPRTTGTLAFAPPRRAYLRRRDRRRAAGPLLSDQDGWRELTARPPSPNPDSR
jgi:hypothetical protein